jgi:hypothetical protein
MSNTSRVVLIAADASGIRPAIAAQNYRMHVCDIDQTAIDVLNSDIPMVSTALTLPKLVM